MRALALERGRAAHLVAANFRCSPLRCPAVAKQKQELGETVMAGIHYIQCDGSTKENALCGAQNIQYTPTTQVSSLRVEGAQPKAAFAHAVRTVQAVAEHLKSSGARLYGKEDCPHTRTQRVLLGLHADTVPFVDCGKYADECRAAGVTSVPTWSIGGALLPAGVHHLTTLAQVSRFPGMDAPGDGQV